MKTLKIKILLFGVIMVFFYLLAFLLPAPKTNQNSLFGNIDKMKLLTNTTTPKIVLVGGSNVSFGINSERIQAELQKPTINMGLHASVGLKYMLEQVIPFIDSNDIVVVCPEFQQYGKGFYGGDELLMMVHDVKAPGSPGISPGHYWKIIENLPYYVGAKYRMSIRNMLNYDDQLKGVYTRSQFNTFGDAVAHLGLPQKNLSPKPINVMPQENIIIEINCYAKKINDKGAHFMFGFPSICESAYTMSDNLSAFRQELFAPGLIDFDVISELEDYVFEDHLFYDTVYHLNREGREIRTSQLIEDIKSAIHDDIE